MITYLREWFHKTKFARLNNKLFYFNQHLNDQKAHHNEAGISEEQP